MNEINQGNKLTYKGIRKFRQNKIKLEMRLKDHMYNKK